MKAIGKLDLKQSKNCIVWFYILAIYVLIPYYNKGSYDNITQDKIEIFYSLCKVLLVIYAVISIVIDVYSGKKGGEKGEENNSAIKLDLMDISVLALGFSCLLSTVLSGYRKEALYGVPGFGMGSLSLLIMIISYYLISRSFIYREWLLWFILISSIPGMLLTVINRLGYDPLHMYKPGENPKFHLYVSTFGNYGWYCQYLSILIPIAVFLLFNSTVVLERILSFIHIALALWSVYLAGNKAIVISLSVVLFVVVSYKFITLKGKTISIKAAVFVLAFAFIGANTLVVLFRFPDRFANNRGYIWNLSKELLLSLPVYRWITGVGPNCYMYSLNDFLSQNADKLEVFKKEMSDLALTSAHNECYDYLIDQGIIGAASYIAILLCTVLCILRYIEKNGKDNMVIICGLTVMSYYTYNFLNFSTICATPYLFICLGILSSIMKKDHTTVSQNP